MKFNACRGLFLASALLGACGCAETNVGIPDVEVTEDDIKDRLVIISQTGMAGSGLAGMEDVIDGYPSGKRDSLMKELQELKSARDPNKVRDIAKKMVGML